MSRWEAINEYGERNGYQVLMLRGSLTLLTALQSSTEKRRGGDPAREADTRKYKVRKVILGEGLMQILEMRRRPEISIPCRGRSGISDVPSTATN
jgi:hypothetical protein